MCDTDDELERTKRELHVLREKYDACKRRENAWLAIEHALRSSEHTLKLVMDTIPQRLFWKDRQSRFLGCNRAFAADAGLDSPDDIIGASDDEMPWSASAAQYQADDRGVMSSAEGKLDYEERMLGEAQDRWLRTSKIPLRDARGTVIGIFGCYEDITDRRLAEIALKEREERYRTLVELASDCISVASNEGRLLEVNAAGTAMLGYSEIELKELTFQQLGIGELPRERLNSGESVVLSRELLAKDGSLLHVELSMRQLPDGRLHSIMRDVSERHRAQMEHHRLEEQLRHAQKLESIGRLAGGIAHDFNNLLTVILANCGFLLSEFENSDPRCAYARLIGESGERAAALTRQLLAFSRKQVVQPRLLDLGEVLTEMERMLRRVVGEDIDFHVSAAEEAGLVLLDPSQFEQVLLNLVVNARDAMPRGGTLELRCEPVSLDGHELTSPAVPGPGPYVAICVTDSGEGMSSEVMENIFEPFFTTKDVGKGTGLGLATAYGIVTQAGGCLSVRSSPGAGSCFKLYFPRATDDSVANRRPSFLPHPPSLRPQTLRIPQTILLAEDDANVASVATQVLKRAGYRLLVADGGLRAIQLFIAREGPIDLLLTDVVMPGMSGPELAAELRLRAPSLPVLYMSGYADSTVAPRTHLEPGSNLLQKPFTATALLRYVQRALEQDE